RALALRRGAGAGGLVRRLVGGRLVRGRLVGRRLFRRGGGGRGPAVVAVEAAALEGDADGPEHLAQRATTHGARRQRVVLERLDDLQVLAAGLAGVLVGRHLR